VGKKMAKSSNLVDKMTNWMMRRMDTMFFILRNTLPILVLPFSIREDLGLS